MEFNAQIEDRSFFIYNVPSSISIDGELFEWDLSQISDRKFHIILDSKTFAAEVISLDKVSKKVSIKINGIIREVTLKDKFDLLLEKMGLSPTNANAITDLKAPMPGLIISIKVEPGQAVAKGDQLLVLEAMKMENIIKAQGEGIVKTIKAKVGDSVEKNQVLIEFL
jgi:acetyl/propionyl-CoA carboxylase alpha subunit